MIRDLVDSNDPILREKLEDFDFSNPGTDPVQLSRDLAETMIIQNGLGLAANQIGERHRAFAMKAEQIIVCFNPKIVDASEETVLLEEGCLSYPGLLVKIKRPKKIRVRYTMPNGEVETRVFDGLTARVFQHELDHLDGICHINRANAIHKKQALAKWKKLQRERKKELQDV